MLDKTACASEDIFSLKGRLPSFEDNGCLALPRFDQQGSGRRCTRLSDPRRVSGRLTSSEELPVSQMIFYFHYL